MAQQVRRHRQHGVEVEQINLSGNWYTPVDERIRLAFSAPAAAVQGAQAAGYRVLSHKILPVGERWAYTCTIEYPVGSGRTYPGSDYISLKDDAGLAKAETSAIGRALGLAGIAIEGGIASAEEVRRVAHHEAPAPPAPPAPQGHSLRLADKADQPTEDGDQDDAPDQAQDQDQDQTQQPLPMRRPRPQSVPPSSSAVVELADCWRYAEAHGLDRETYQRAVGKYGVRNPAYLLAGLEEYVEKLAARAHGGGKTNG